MGYDLDKDPDVKRRVVEKLKKANGSDVVKFALAHSTALFLDFMRDLVDLRLFAGAEQHDMMMGVARCACDELNIRLRPVDQSDEEDDKDSDVLSEMLLEIVSIRKTLDDLSRRRR